MPVLGWVLKLRRDPLKLEVYEAIRLETGMIVFPDLYKFLSNFPRIRIASSLDSVSARK